MEWKRQQYLGHDRCCLQSHSQGKISLQKVTQLIHLYHFFYPFIFIYCRAIYPFYQFIFFKHLSSIYKSNQTTTNEQIQAHKSEPDQRNVNEREEILSVFDLVLRSVKPLIFFVTKNIHQQSLYILLLSLHRIYHVNNRLVRSKPHVGFNHHSQHFGVSIHLVHLWKVSVANLWNCLGLVLQSLLKRFFLFSSCFGKTSFKLELLYDYFEFLSGLFTELLEWSHFLFLSS